jgi:hypothetical protein
LPGPRTKLTNQPTDNPAIEPTLAAGRAPAAVRKLYQDFFVGGKSGQIGHTQAIDLLHEEREKELHRGGDGSTEKGSVGTSALLDHTSDLRAFILRQGGVKDPGIKPRNVPPSIDDETRALNLLRKSGFSTAVRGRGCQTIDGLGLPVDADKLLEVGFGARSRYADRIRDGTWVEKHVTFPSRHRVVPSEDEDAEEHA